MCLSHLYWIQIGKSFHLGLLCAPENVCYNIGELWKKPESNPINWPINENPFIGTGDILWLFNLASHISFHWRPKDYRSTALHWNCNSYRFYMLRWKSLFRYIGYPILGKGNTFSQAIICITRPMWPNLKLQFSKMVDIPNWQTFNPGIIKLTSKLP